MPNRLADETSPYLLQHKDNPVNWYPWGDEALARARDEDKPIFLSIGYSACHWCHVMEHESFENDTIASKLNDDFISIKVDREERPDLDQIYMNAVQAMTGHGGWPMSVFLTTSLEPFYGGTYWPPAPRMGMPGFGQVLEGVHAAWRDRREQALEQAAKLTQFLRAQGSGQSEMQRPPSDEDDAVEIDNSDAGPDESLLARAESSLHRIFDHANGSFGGAPKFPHPMNLRLLLRLWQRTDRAALKDMVTLTLDKMAAGGIYDQLGGGFHRYSVDARWLVPHFEKMLYDNALLASCYVEAFLATSNSDYARVARETLDYVLREMQHPDGGFYSTQDADSEGVEGKFFVWTPDEIRELLGDEAAKSFCRVYDVSESGNFEGENILNLPKPISVCARLLDRDEDELCAELAASRTKLFDIRERRIHPGLDDKVLVAWNGLMIDAMAQAAGVLNERRYLRAANAAADFILNKMRRDDGRLLHTWRLGQAKLDAYLDDYASMVNALVSLYEADFNEHRIDQAVELADILLAFFHDTESGGFFFTASDHEKLIARQKDLTDNAVPSGSALAATALLRLGKLTGRRDFLDAAVGTLKAAEAHMAQHPMAMGQMLLALDFHIGPTYEVVVAGGSVDDEVDDILHNIRSRYLPRRVLACRADEAATRSKSLCSVFEGKQSRDGQPALFICQNFACGAPAVGKEDANSMLDNLD
jgi:hypothetical protein